MVSFEIEAKRERIEQERREIRYIGARRGKLEEQKGIR